MNGSRKARISLLCSDSATRSKFEKLTSLRFSPSLLRSTAGQMLFDKKRHLDALILSQIMLEDHKFWFMFSDGGSSSLSLFLFDLPELTFALSSLLFAS